MVGMHGGFLHRVRRIRIGGRRANRCRPVTFHHAGRLRRWLSRSVSRRRLVLRRAVRVRWPLHLAAWLAAAAPAVLLGGWEWLAAGPAGSEVLLLAATLRARRVRPASPGNGGRPEGPWGAGDREPRRPLPVTGAGSAALPLPTERRYVKLV